MAFVRHGIQCSHLLRPTAVIPAECFRAAVARDLVEAGLREQKQRAAGGLLQLEFDERGVSFRIVRFGIDGIRVPGEGKSRSGSIFCTTASILHARSQGGYGARET